MALKSGMNSSVGLAEETTYGTYEAPTRWLPHVEFPIEHEIERMESEGIIAGRRVLDSAQWEAGNISVSTSIGFELYDRSIGLLFKHMFGDVATTGAGPFTHTFTPGDLTGLGLTIQGGAPDTTDGTVHPYSLLGSKITDWELACSAGEVATLGTDIVSQSVTTAETLVAPAYAAGIGIGLTFVGGSVTIDGSPYRTMEATLSAANGLNVDRRFIGDQNIAEPLESELREYSGELNSEFFDLTAYNRFVNGTEVPLVLAFARGTATATITMNVRFDGEAPQVEGRDVIMETLPFKAVGASDADAITAELVNDDATP